MHTCEPYTHVAAAGLNFYSSYFSIALHTVEWCMRPRNPFRDPGEFICSDETEKAIPKNVFLQNAIRSAAEKIRRGNGELVKLSVINSSVYMAY